MLCIFCLVDTMHNNAGFKNNVVWNGDKIKEYFHIWFSFEVFQSNGFHEYKQISFSSFIRLSKTTTESAISISFTCFQQASNRLA